MSLNEAKHIYQNCITNGISLNQILLNPYTYQALLKVSNDYMRHHYQIKHYQLTYHIYLSIRDVPVKNQALIDYARSHNIPLDSNDDYQRHNVKRMYLQSIIK